MIMEMMKKMKRSRGPINPEFNKVVTPSSHPIR
jgi:hypothetical protein